MTRMRQPYSRHTRTTVDLTDIELEAIRTSATWLDHNFQRRMILEFDRPPCPIAVEQLRYLNHRHLDRLRQATSPPKRGLRYQCRLAVQQVLDYCLRLTGKHQWA